MHLRTPRLVRRLSLAPLALLLAITVAACGSDDARTNSTPTPVPTPTPLPHPTPAGGTATDTVTTDTGDDPTAPYRAGEPAFYDRFLYLANAHTDLDQPEADLFVDGVFACQTFASGSGAVEDVTAALANNRGLTDDGAHAVAAAATEELCTGTGITVTTRTESDAAQIAERVGNDLGGAQVLEEQAMVDIKLACDFLDGSGPAGLREYLRSEGKQFVDGAASDHVLNVLIVDGVGIHCPANSPRLGPNFTL
jgi:hypothetical protein